MARALGWAYGVAALSVVGLAAQTAAGQRLPAFSSEVSVVSLPVFVTDADGRSVAGLKAEDFTVLDEGRPVPIAGFREIDATRIAETPELRDAPAARRQFLLLFDLSFSGVSGLVRSRQAAARFVDALQPADLASVATFSANRGIRVLVGFTADRVQLRRAIDTLGVSQLERAADPLGLVYDLRDVGAALADEPDEVASSQLADTIRAIQIRYQRAEEAAYRRRILALIDSMGQLAGALDAVQGRKQVIFLSQGFDESMLVGQTGAQAARDSNAVISGRLWEVQSDARFGDTEIRSQMSEVLQRFSRSDAVVHAIDLSGLTARGDARLQVGEPARRSGVESLAEISSLAGGRLFKDANDLRPAFDQILEMSRHYYLLAFEPGQGLGPGRFHKVRVRLKGKGRKVAHRSGYYERQPFGAQATLSRQFEAAEMIAKGVTGGDIQFTVTAVPYRAPDGRTVLSAVVEVDGPSLLAAAQGRTELGLEIYGYALDAAGAVEDFVGFTFNVERQRVEAKLRERGLQCHATFTVPAGRHELRFLVREAHSGLSGSRWLEVAVPRLEAGHVVLFPPMVMDDPARWVMVEATSRESAGPAQALRVADGMVAPVARPRLGRGETHRMLLLAFDGGARHDPGASFDISVQVKDAAGAAVAMGPFRLSRSEVDAAGFRRFVLNFTADLSPGEYTFHVGLREPVSGRVSESHQRVHVE